MNLKKSIAVGAVGIALATAPAYAGNLVEPMMEPEVIVEEASNSSGGFIIPLLLLAIIAAAASSGSSPAPVSPG